MKIRSKYWLLVIAAFFFSCQEKTKEQPVSKSKIAQPQKTPSKSSLEMQLEKAGLVDVHKMDSTIRFNLKYATNDNFTHTVLYDTLRTIYLQPKAAKMLVNAQKILRAKDSTLSLIVFDAARPLSVQHKMYQRVAGTPYASYVASPQKNGLHNFGCAVDMGICRRNGSLLDMGTPFDFFGKQAGILHEQEFIAQGVLTKQQVHNRMLLRQAMRSAGFLTVTGEWWHFNSCLLLEAKKKYKLID